jgi:toxin ParE1/3/4
MRIGYSDAAVEDLAAIGAQGIARFGRASTESYLAKLRYSIAIIAETPHIAHLRKEVSRPLRIHASGAHVIIYEARDNMIHIVRILSARQNWIDHI